MQSPDQLLAARIKSGTSVDDGQLGPDHPNPPLFELGVGCCAAGALPGRHCGELIPVGQVQGHSQHFPGLLIGLDVPTVPQGYEEAGHIICAPELLVRVCCLCADRILGRAQANQLQMLHPPGP